MRHHEGLAGKLALALGATLFTLLVLVSIYEAVANVRYYRWRARFGNEGWIGKLTVPSPDPELLWEYRPYGEADGVATNRWGFREIDLPTPQKPPGVRRFAFLGDSVTLGMGVEPGATFVRLAAGLSDRAGHPVQTLNFGVDGYHVLQLRKLLTARVLSFEPDQVIYVMCINDFDFTDSSGRKIAYFRKPWLFLPQDLERRFRALFGIDYHRHHFLRNRTRVFRVIQEMKEVLVARGIEFGLLLLPVFPTAEAERSDATYFSRYPLQDIHSQVSRFCAEEAIRVHDLLGDFRDARLPPQRHSLDVWHLNAEGHRLVADRVLRLLAAPVAPGVAWRP